MPYPCEAQPAAARIAFCFQRFRSRSHPSFQMRSPANPELYYRRLKELPIVCNGKSYITCSSRGIYVFGSCRIPEGLRASAKTALYIRAEMVLSQHGHAQQQRLTIIAHAEPCNCDTSYYLRSFAQRLPVRLQSVPRALAPKSAPLQHTQAQKQQLTTFFL